MEMRRTDVCGKMKTLVHLLDHIYMEGEKVLVFSFSVQLLNVLEAYAQGAGNVGLGKV